MEPYLVFMDIDGTLIDNHQNVLPETKRTIEKLQQRGVIFYIATGRMLSLAELIRNKINDQVEIIASNGSVYQKGHHFHKEHLGWNALKEIYNITSELGLSTNFFTTDMTYYTHEKPWMLSRLARVRVMADKTGNRRFEKVRDLEHLHQLSSQIINGITIDKTKSERLDEAREKMEATGLLKVSSSSPNNLELIPRRISKATAVRAIMDKYGIPLERTIAFGNDMNDLEMIKAVGTGVAMGNSPQILKDEADAVTDSNVENGIRNFLESYFKI
ncbi:HAD family hydrolase [Pediococcus pentosaceus]|uniref:HAD family hydrolase n=1 Tax=Pediococcus pentosaceus TaxID=1255 RepID=UPI003161C332